MSEPIDTSNPLSPPATFILRGSFLGAILFYLLSLALIAAIFLPSMYRERLGWKSLLTPETFSVLSISALLSLITAMIGFFVGREGARCPTVNAAFLRGGILCGSATMVSLPLLFFTYFRTLKIYTSGFFILCIVFLAILTASGSLVSGLAAILVRDRRESGYTRLIPQFTLQEIFIVFTIVSIIISAMTSVAVLRM
jgi:hypothetical protein